LEVSSGNSGLFDSANVLDCS